ncbi:alpha/beta fold hydrolase [Streptomyces lavendulocolor]|uniref:alpha/beta fold hydrolase n=1 Tax=Streptomyces lavendulocolor TaxID=67316 RepID=UPI003C30660E
MANRSADTNAPGRAIVRSDMLGTLKTLGPSGADGQGEMTFDRIYADAVEVTDHIRTRLGVDKVVLLGHSYGSPFGLRLALEFLERPAVSLAESVDLLCEGLSVGGLAVVEEPADRSVRKPTQLDKRGVRSAGGPTWRCRRGITEGGGRGTRKGNA